MPKVPTNPDEAKCKEIRDRFDEAFTKWKPIYDDGDKNMKYIAGDPWETNDRKAREDAGRPVVTFDELGQYLNQAVNEVRANPRAPKFNPEGDGATDDTARFYANHFRKIEYDSNAQEAYTTAYENALQRGYGFVRLRLEYEHARSHYQRLRIEAVPNPSCCYPDPDAVRPDGTDWKYFFFIESYTKSEFERAFPEAEFTTFSTEQIADVGPVWMGPNKVQVAEYWEVEEEDAELVEYEVPATRLKPMRYESIIEGVDKKPRGGKEIQRRTTTVRTVCMYRTNGVELLAKGGVKKFEHPGEHIPFASCYGKIVWLNKGSGPERVILAMTTLAREPFMAYCFAAATELEILGSITKNPFFAYRGQVTQQQKNEVAKSLHEPVAVLEFEAFLPQAPTQLIPLPVRNPMSVDLSAAAIVRENAKRAIQAAMQGTPLPTSMQKDNAKLSGRAMDRFEESGQRGNYHFIDHYNDLLRRIGVIYEDIEDKVLDVEREVSAIGPDKQAQRWLVNTKQTEAQNGVEILPSTKGRHSVTVDVGPETVSERQEAGKFLDNFVTSPMMAAIEPAKRDKLIALSIKERVMGPMGEKMADVISPPESEDGEQMIPQAKVQELIAAGNAVQQGLQAQIAELTQKLEAKVVETEGKLVVQAAADKTKKEIAQLTTEQKAIDSERDSATALAIAEMRLEIDKLKVALETKKIEQAREIEGARLEQQTYSAERGHEASETEAERSREAASEEAERSRAHESAEGEATRKAAADQADKAAKAKAKEPKT